MIQKDRKILTLSEQKLGYNKKTEYKIRLHGKILYTTTQHHRCCSDNKKDYDSGKVTELTITVGFIVRKLKFVLST